MDHLISAIKRRDRDALNQFLARHRDQLTDWVRFRLGVPSGRGADPSDAVQEVSVKVWQSVGTFGGTTEAQFLHWIRTYLRWWVIDLSRQRVLRNARDSLGRLAPDIESGLSHLAADTHSPSQLAFQAEREALIRRAADSLTNEQITIVTLHDVDGVRLKAIAGEFGVSPVSIAQQYLAAVTALRASGVILTESTTSTEDALPPTRLAHALERLPIREHHAVLLKHLEDFTMEEAAATLGTTTGAIGAAVYRGMKALRTLLDDETSPQRGM